MCVLLRLEVHCKEAQHALKLALLVLTAVSMNRAYKSLKLWDQLAVRKVHKLGVIVCAHVKGILLNVVLLCLR